MIDPSASLTNALQAATLFVLVDLRGRIVRLENHVFKTKGGG